MHTRFWKGKRVFITGHSGFKGGWMSIWLNSLGANVKGFSLDAPTEPSLFASASIGDLVESEIGDIRDAEALAESMQAFQPDIIFHLAAQSLVRLSYSEPVDTFSTNVMGTVNVLETARNIDSVGAVVIVTSDKCYENREWHWGYRESEPLGGYDTYSASKACAELVTNAYRQSFFQSRGRESSRGRSIQKKSVGGKSNTAVASARAGNVVGGGDWAADRLVPDILRSLQSNKPVVIRNPNAIRPWQHVLEPLSGYMLLAKLLFEKGDTFAQAWNFGPSDTGAKSVQWVTEEVISQWGAGSWELKDGDHLHEATYLKLDCSKATLKLGWLPVWNPSEVLAATVNWHKAWDSGANVHELCIRDINRYTQHFLRLTEKSRGCAEVL